MGAKFVLSVAAVALGCSSAGESKTSAAEVEATQAETVSGGNPDGAAAGTDCPILGEFELESLDCGGVDATAEFRKLVATSRLTLLNTATGCRGLIENTGPSCRETAEQDAKVVSSGEWSITSTGVATCEPEGCSFSAQDAPCKIGDRAATWIEGITIEPDRLTCVRSDPQNLCSGFGLSPMTLVWRRIGG